MRNFILYQNDDGEWVAEAEELPGYRVKGKSKEEALEKIQAVLKIYYPCKCED